MAKVLRNDTWPRIGVEWVHWWSISSAPTSDEICAWPITVRVQVVQVVPGAKEAH